MSSAAGWQTEAQEVEAVDAVAAVCLGRAISHYPMGMQLPGVDDLGRSEQDGVLSNYNWICFGIRYESRSVSSQCVRIICASFVL